jgi:hypothetical protein
VAERRLIVRAPSGARAAVTHAVYEARDRALGYAIERWEDGTPYTGPPDDDAEPAPAPPTTEARPRRRRR